MSIWVSFPRYSYKLNIDLMDATFGNLRFVASVINSIHIPSYAIMLFKRINKITYFMIHSPQLKLLGSSGKSCSFV